MSTKTIEPWTPSPSLTFFVGAIRVLSFGLGFLFFLLFLRYYLFGGFLVFPFRLRFFLAFVVFVFIFLIVIVVLSIGWVGRNVVAVLHVLLQVDRGMLTALLVLNYGQIYCRQGSRNPRRLLRRHKSLLIPLGVVGLALLSFCRPFLFIKFWVNLPLLYSFSNINWNIALLTASQIIH